MATPLQLMLLLPPLLLGLFILGAAQQPPPPPPSITLPGCRDKCGNISIPYPFGIGPGCFIASQFEVLCNDTGGTPRAFLVASNVTNQKNVEAILSADTIYPFTFNASSIPPSPIELIDISLATSEVRAYGAVSSYCATSPSFTDYQVKLQLTSVSSHVNDAWPLVVSKRNDLVGVGIILEARLARSLYMDSPVSEELPYIECTSSASFGFRRLRNGSCAGSGCCQVPFALNEEEYNPVSKFAVSFRVGNNYVDEVDVPCVYGMVVERSFYNFSTPDLDGYNLSQKLQRGVPFVIDFAIMTQVSWAIGGNVSLGVYSQAGNGSCPAQGQHKPPGYACVSSNSFCSNASWEDYMEPDSIFRGLTYRCNCMEHFQGNPYIPNGCQDVDECKNPDLYPCHGHCTNIHGGYDCACKRGLKGDGKAGTCKPIFPLVAKVIVGAGVFIGLIVGTFLFILLKERRKSKDFYKKNGGPILEKAKLIKLFRKKDLKKILMDSNIIGEGFFGQVYKGVLDNEQVAIKKPKNVGVLEHEQFANEVIIQSQVSHKNIVRLTGCCLEVDTPMLVYEFIANGSLHDILHENKNNNNNNNNHKVDLSLDRRLSIAAQSADGLAYMHSKTNTEILHGDVKPANILLDDNFVPKIADFGLSRLIVKDIKHTDSVIGDINYMDPVYQKEGLLTGKSDVYSFGLVILELISRRKAVHSEANNLLNSFREAQEKEKKGTELFDEDIAGEDLEVLNSVRELAMECLRLEVDQRPTMTEVAERLFLMIRSCQQ